MANVPGALRRPLVPSPVGRVKMPPHLPFDLCHLPFDLLVPEKKFKIQMAKGKWQMFRIPCTTLELLVDARRFLLEPNDASVSSVTRKNLTQRSLRSSVVSVLRFRKVGEHGEARFGCGHRAALCKALPSSLVRSD